MSEPDAYGAEARRRRVEGREGRRRVTSADGAHLAEGDRAFNHYDMKAGVLGPVDERAQPDPAKGQSSSTPQEEWSNRWFEFRHDDGTRASLDGSRVCTEAFARRRGWLA